MNDKTTDQPIPGYFMKWVDGFAADTRQRNLPTSFLMQEVAIATYRHLHSIGDARILDRQEYSKWIRKTIEDELSDGNRESLAERLAFEFDAHVTCVYEGGEEWKSLYENLKAKAHSLPPSPVGEETKEGFLRGHAPTIFSYLADHVLNDIYCAMQAYADRPAPSRAGEISPALPRWVKIKERLPKGVDTDKIIVRYLAGHTSEQPLLTFKYDENLKYMLEWLEESLPTPAPEVKDEEPLEMLLEFETYGDTIQFDCPDDDSDIAVRVKNKGARLPMVFCLTLDEAAEVATFLSRHVNNAKLCNPEPVKDTPAGQEGADKRTFTQDRSKPLPFICSTHDLEYDGECPECIAEQPAHVPAPKGEIPGEIGIWIGDQLDKHGILAGSNIFKEGAIAMYYKMKEDIEIAGRLYLIACPEVSALTSERDTARQGNESLIVSVEGWESKYHKAEEEAGEYCALVKDLADGAYHISEPLQERAQQLLTKYKPTT